MIDTVLLGMVAVVIFVAGELICAVSGRWAGRKAKGGQYPRL